MSNSLHSEFTGIGPLYRCNDVLVVEIRDTKDEVSEKWSLGSFIHYYDFLHVF